MEEQDERPRCLTDEQVEEVKRRIADPETIWITLAEVRERLRKLGE